MTPDFGSVRYGFGGRARPCSGPVCFKLLLSRDIEIQDPEQGVRWIENAEITYHDTREIFENDKVTGYIGSPRALFEQQNQKFCYEVFKKKITVREPVSVELIQEIHRVFTSGTYDVCRYIDKGERPGEFKKHDYVTGIHEVGFAPEEVESDLRELISQVNEIGRKKPLKTGTPWTGGFAVIKPNKL